MTARETFSELGRLRVKYLETIATINGLPYLVLLVITLPLFLILGLFICLFTISFNAVD